MRRRPDSLRCRCRQAATFTLMLLVIGLLTACDPRSTETGNTIESKDQTSAPAAAENADEAIFREVANDLGLIFTHFNGATNEAFMAEIMGSGAALFDYDNDGDLDAYLVQGGRINEVTPLRFPASAVGSGGRLFRNRLIPDGALGFDDVTDGSGIKTSGHGMGVATGDLDNDGDLDLYLSNLGPDALYLNNGDGTFSDNSKTLDMSVDDWSTSASMFDFDTDGHLDIVVARYVQLDRVNARRCQSSAGLRDYCTPDVYRPLTDTLLRGDGRGNLETVPDWQHPAPAPSTGLGVITGDFDGDGRPDIYVANDKKANQLWLNQGAGRFEDGALLSGSAFNGNGKAEASMGVTAGDVDMDGDADIFVTHLKGETNTLYLNNGDGLFFDATIATKLAAPSVPATGFGTHWFDMDNDGDLDLFSANGAVMIEPAQMGEQPFPYVQPNQLFENQGTTFVDASARAGFTAERPEISRGAAFGDIDNDGDVDILVSNNNGAARLLLNETAPRGRWLSLRLLDESGNRDGVGSRIGVSPGDGRELWRWVGTDGSYLSASDIRAHFGLGETDQAVSVLVIWPDGAGERWQDVSANQSITLVRGSGSPVGR